MNKRILLTGFLALVIVSAIACSPSDHKLDESEKDKSYDEVEREVKTEAEPKPTTEPYPVIKEYSLSEKERNQAAKEMGEEEMAVVSDEEMVASSIMSMSLQKVELKENENFEIAGTIVHYRPQITKENIAYLKEKVETIESNPILEEILIKWSQGNFEDVDKDFILARNVLTGQEEEYSSVIKKRSEEEEERYIRHFYGDEGWKIDKDQWR